MAWHKHALHRLLSTKPGRPVSVKYLQFRIFRVQGSLVLPPPPNSEVVSLRTTFNALSTRAPNLEGVPCARFSARFSLYGHG